MTAKRKPIPNQMQIPDQACLAESVAQGSRETTRCHLGKRPTLLMST